MKLKRLLTETAPELDAFAKTIKDKFDLKTFTLMDDRQGNIELASIELTKKSQGQGNGSRAMAALCEYADRNQRLIWLSVAEKNKETGTTSKGRLKQFYKRFGFVENKGRNKRFDLSLYATMYRDPR